MNKKKVIMFILMIVLIIISIIFVIYYKELNRYKKIIEADIKSQYTNSKISINFVDKRPCIERYNTIAGDSGSGRRNIKGCYVYFFDVSIDNMKTKYYYLVTPNGNKIYNENEYTIIGNNLYDYKNILGSYEVRYLYYSTRESENETTLDNALNNKNIILYFNDSLKNIVDKDFLINYSNLEDMINTQINEKNIKINILLEFSDKYAIDYRYGTYQEKYYYNTYSSETYEIFKFNDFNSLSEYIEKNGLKDGISIINKQGNLSDEIIKWCIDNKKDSYYYED